MLHFLNRRLIFLCELFRFCEGIGMYAFGKAFDDTTVMV